MGPIGAISRTPAAAIGRLRTGRTTQDSGAGVEASASRALVAVAPPAASEAAPSVSRRPSAGFLAQLIATAQQEPQTRARRRAEPEVAISRYRATAAGNPAEPRFQRSC